MKNWLNSLKIYADRRMAVMLLLGFVSGLPFLLVSSTLSLWLKDAGISLAAIGLFSIVKAPYSFKWMLSPLIDQYRLPLFSRLGRRRGWAVFLQLLLMSALLGMSWVNPKISPILFVAFAGLTALFSASQDIVLDAYRIERFSEKEQAAGVAVFVLGYRLGTVFSGAGALFLASVLSWGHVYQIMAGGVLVGFVTILFAKEPEGNKPAHPQTARAVVVNAVVKPFTDFMKHKKWPLILLFIFFYRMSDAYVAPMAYPFFDDMGFSKIQIASIIKIYGVLATIIGTLIGGMVVSRIGLVKSLVLCGFFGLGLFSGQSLFGFGFFGFQRGLGVRGVGGFFGRVHFLGGGFAQRGGLLLNTIHIAVRISRGAVARNGRKSRRGDSKYSKNNK